ncbi:MAG: hypothetical protein IPM79_04030 [Polyangiaceae bacterium]|jgi:TusA-related sulfurtransferase|nr:hypothetical protein [Polyangiaceae bacterium]MBK8936825.1 hypothetical protein [Polyangiaceae bacterium]
MKISYAALLTVALAACGPTEQTSPSASGKPGSASASQKPAGSAPASASTAKATAATSASAAPSEEARGKMMNCPAAAANAKTEVKDVDKGVEITVTASDKVDIEEIKKRAKAIEERAKAEEAAPQHTGKGGGAGATGRCPIVIGGTNVVVAAHDSGAKFTVTAKDDKEVDWLRRETKERLAAIKEGGGERKMANCPSAVKGAKTTVKEAGGAIVVSVTAKDEAATKDIRERAKKLPELKHDKADKDPHDGSGAGAGEGRCPAVIEGTTATVKDVDGGSEITLKPKTAGDLKKLTQEAQDRAARFD